VIDERLGGTVTKEYITVLAIARRRVAWSGDVSAVNTWGDAEGKSRTRTPTVDTESPGQVKAGTTECSVSSPARPVVLCW
jgi:hypothetical protein